MGWQADMKAAAAHLSHADADLGGWIARVGPCTLKPEKKEPFEILVRSVAAQQVHSKAADAVMRRFLEIYHGYFPTPLLVLATPEAVLRAAGLSQSKVEAVRAIAQGARDGLVPSRQACARLSDETLVNRLVALRGVGRWTAEMVLIFGVGRKDVLPTGDFGVREGFRLLKQHDKQPSPRELEQAAEKWRPWRSVATWYLWQGLELSRRAR